MNSCHDHHKNGEPGKEHSHKGFLSHLWMMALCCGAPIILLAILPLLGNLSPGIRGAVSGILPFLCPILMVGMMLMMFRGNKGKGERENCCAHKQIDEKAMDNNRNL